MHDTRDAAWYLLPGFTACEPAFKKLREKYGLDPVAVTFIFDGSSPPFIVDAFVSKGKPVVVSYVGFIVQSFLGATSNTKSAVVALIAPLPNSNFVPLRVVPLTNVRA